MTDRSYHVVLNAHSGTVLAKGITEGALAEMFEAAGHRATIDADDEQPLELRIKRALESEANVLVAAGGDGTVTALAQAIVGSDKSLAVLPLGTVNALARDLQIPLDLKQAVDAFGTLELRRIDVAEVNGLIYLHNVVVGLIPGMAAAREHIRAHQTLGAKLALLQHFLRRLTRARQLAVAIEVSEGRSRVERAQAVAVACNAYDQGLGHIFSRQRLDHGKLTLYVVKRLHIGDFLRLSVRMLLGRWHDDEVLNVESVKAVTLRSRKPKVKVMFDGEVMMLDTPLAFRIRPLALSVLAPPQTTPPASGPQLVVAER